MEVLYCDFNTINEKDTNFIAQRGVIAWVTDGQYFHLYDHNQRGKSMVAKVQESVVVAFKDILPQMVFMHDMDSLLKDMQEEHYNFHINEIVTIVHFTIHRKY